MSLVAEGSVLEGKIIEEVMGADATSKVVDASGADALSVEIVVPAGTRDGELYLQASNTGNNWVALEYTSGSTSITITGGAASGPHLIDLAISGWKFFRLFWDRTSGDSSTSNLEAWVLQKRGN